MDNQKCPAPAPRPTDAGSTSGVGAAAGQSSSRWQDHPLVHHQYFPILPYELLEEIEPLLDVGYRRQMPWRLEQRLSKAASQQADIVAFWDGKHAIKHPHLLLHQYEEEEEDDDNVLARMSLAEAARLEEAGLLTSGKRRTFLSHKKIAGAYCGWLMTCSQFIQEHDLLLRQLENTLQSNGQLIAPPGPFDALAAARGVDPSSPLMRAYQSLCIKWRLDRLIGPYLPIPVRPTHMVLNTPTTVCRQLPTGMLLHVPDIYGRLTSEQIVDLQSSVAGSGGDEYLDSWRLLLSPANRNKGKQAERYVRRFALLHVWKALLDRHGQALRGKLGPLREVLGEQFSMKASAVRLNLIRS